MIYYDLTKSVLWSSRDGWNAEITAYDADGNFYGAKWYGTLQECNELDPTTVPLRPFQYNTTDPFDIACERRYDNEYCD